MKKHYTLLLATFLLSLTLSAQGVVQVFKTNNSSLVYNDIRAIDFDNQGRVWIGTYNGISVYDNGSWTTYTTSNSGLVNNAIVALVVDPQDNVWVGTSVGVSKYDGSSWTTYTSSNSGLSTNNVRSIGFDSQGNIWFGTSGSGADKYNGTSFTNYNTSDGLAHDFVQGIAQDHSGNMWFATSLGVSKRSAGGTWTTYDDNNVYPANSINLNDLAVDSAGHIWTGSSKGLSLSGGGAAHYNQSSWTILKSQNTGLVYNEVVDVAVDPGNDIWFATDGGGVSYYNYTDSIWKTINTSDGLPNNNCQAVGFDMNGNIWIGTDNGIARLNPIKVNNINTQNITCDTIMGTLDVSYNSVRNGLRFSIDSGMTYVNTSTFTGLQAGDYHIMVTDSLYYKYAGKATISIEPVKYVDLGPDTTICNNETVVLDAGSGFLTYLWSIGLTQQAITVDGSAVGPGMHTFFVTTRDSNLCETSDTLILEVKDCSSIEENSLQVSLSPNPASDYLSIAADMPLDEIIVFSISGQKIIHKTGIQQSSYTLDTKPLNPGTYIIRIKNKSGITGQMKFMKR